MNRILQCCDDQRELTIFFVEVRYVIKLIELIVKIPSQHILSLSNTLCRQAKVYKNKNVRINRPRLLSIAAPVPMREAEDFLVEDVEFDFVPQSPDPFRLYDG